MINSQLFGNLSNLEMLTLSMFSKFSQISKDKYFFSISLRKKLQSHPYRLQISIIGIIN